MKSEQYAGKTAVVTGASTGIGEGIALELARRGADVILVARRSELLGQLARRIESEGGRATPVPCDVTDETSLKTLVRQVRQQCGKIHLLVNNAGKELVKPLQVTKSRDVRELLEVNVVAVAEVTRRFLPLLSEGSAVVNLASAAGITGAAGLSAYAASKGAVIALTKSLAKELAGRGIRVNSVAPAMVRTEMAERMLGKLTPEQAAELEAAHPLGFGTPADVAAGVAFLGSDEAAWITGHTLVIDGGFLSA